MDIEELRRLRRVRDRIDREFAEPLDVSSLAETAIMSPGHFARRFKDVYGETPYAYLLTRRVERAAALLRGGMSVSRACADVGYTSLGSFSTRFTDVMGQTPSDYRAADDGHLDGEPRCQVMAFTRPRRSSIRSTPRSVRIGEVPPPHSS